MSYLIAFLILALFPAIIASAKGRSFALWYVYGFCFWLIALIHAMCLAGGIRGLRLNHVVPGEMGHRIGLYEGDLVLDLNGGRPSNAGEFQRLLRMDAQSITVMRGAQFIVLSAPGGHFGIGFAPAMIPEYVIANHGLWLANWRTSAAPPATPPDGPPASFSPAPAVHTPLAPPLAAPVLPMARVHR